MYILDSQWDNITNLCVYLKEKIEEIPLSVIYPNKDITLGFLNIILELQDAPIPRKKRKAKKTVKIKSVDCTNATDVVQ